MEQASSPPPHSCSFCQQFVVEFEGDEATNSKNLIDGLRDAQVRTALQRRRFNAPETLAALRRYHIFDFSVAALESATQVCPLADLFKKSVPEASEYMPLTYPPEQTIFAAKGPFREYGLSIGALEIDEVQYVGPDMKETTRLNLNPAAVFDVVKVPGDAASEKFGLNPVSKNPGSPSAHELTRSWLKACLETHESCPKPSATWMPTRLLKISRSSRGRLLQLHETESGAVEPYAALTYCWGGPQPVVTNAGNRQEHLAKIDIDKLPKTLQDALVATEELGLSLLWIDALCIIQDDDKDKAMEIASMALLYLNATVIIGACRASTVRSGFLGLRTPPEYDYSNTKAVIQMRFRRSDGQEGSMLLVPFTDQQMEPIDARAWTYQERLLSLRYLEYGSVQTQWYCNGVGRNEVLVDGLDRPTLSRERFNQGLMSAHAVMRDPMRPLDDDYQLVHLWEGLIIEHSSRQLTVATDRLPSLAGIAQRFAEAMKVKGDEYLCGLWKRDLPRLLMWEYTPRPDVVRPTQYIAPSWSWASMNALVQFHSRERYPFAQFERQVHESFGFVGCEIQLVDERSPFGAVLSGSLKLKGILKSVEWDRSKLQDSSWQIRFGSTSVDASVDDNNLWLLVDEDSTESVIPIFLLTVLEAASRCIEGLVLRQKDGGCFMRWGTFCYFHHMDNSLLAKLLWPQNLDAQVVELV